ncbi:hypothetical protein quinque_000119 [Culex quinquefasciatus]
MRDQDGGTYTHNFDLTFFVLFNLANNVNRLKINMGNIYFQLGLYTKAIKMYRMALDQVPSNQKELRLKITHNIGILFIKMGQYSDAATSFEFIMSEKGDLKTGLHLILCYYALGDVEKIKHAFQLLLDIQVDYLEDEKVFQTNSTPPYEIHQRNDQNILISANLISTIIDDYFNDGYSWCVETIKNSYFSSLAVDLELKKAVIYLKQDDIQQAIDTLKYFEKKESNIAINAAINLSFIHILKKDITTAETYADTAKRSTVTARRRSSTAASAAMMKEDFETAKLMFMNALDIDSTSFEALYNIGLIFKKLGDHNNSLLYFRKIISNLGHEAAPGAGQQDHQKIGELYETDGERQQAYHYHHESYRIYPIDSSVINWLCSHYIELQVDPYYLLRIAGCYRRIGNQQKSMSLFKMIHEIYPDNADCLRALIHLNQQQGNNELVEEVRRRTSKAREAKGGPSTDWDRTTSDDGGWVEDLQWRARRAFRGDGQLSTAGDGVRVGVGLWGGEQERRCVSGL